jgi:prepilin-type N-terminal cleavage/methylation domain-containing protein
MRVRERMRKILRADSAAGFSMTELIIALAISVIAAVGIYSVYITQTKQSTSQRLYNDLQNNLRYAMDYMKNELYLAGFKAVDAAEPISTATANTITFEYWDDNSSAAPPYDRHIQVTYILAGNELRRTFLQYNTSTAAPNPRYDPSTTVTQVLAKNVDALAFSYRQSDDQPFTVGTDDPEDIRTIRITLAGRSSRPDPILKDPVSGGDYYRKLTLTGEIKSRNLAIASNPFDSTAPGTPTGLNVWDPQECGRLQLEWDARTEKDLAGYTIYYGLSAGNYSGRKRISRSPGTAGAKEYLTLTGLQSYNAMYYVAISSYDRSNNVSAISTPDLYGNPSPDGTTAADGPDSTINPVIPAPPADLAAAYPVDDQVQLSWTPSVTPGVVGYRLFRAEESDFSDEVIIANEIELPAESTGYLDTDGSLVGCAYYFYRIASIHCDAAEFNDGNYTDSDYALISASPTDTVPPSTPNLIARPGYRRIILNLENPVRGDEPDFDYTAVYFSTAGYPTVSEGVVSNGALIPDYSGYISDDGSIPPINFDSESHVTPSEPELQPDTKYYFLAVASDQCGNHTDATSESLAEGQQCGDCDAAEICYEAPPPPTGITKAGCGTSIALNWDAIDQIDYRDLAGFRVLRREGYDWTLNPASEVELTGGEATWFTNWTDTTTSASNPLEMGKRYSYKICSTDCYHEQHSGKSAGDWPDPGNNPDDNIDCTIVNDIYPGKFYLDDQRDVPVTGDLLSVPPNFRHNTVTFLFDNLAAGPLTQTAINLVWDDIDTFLRAIEIGDGSTTVEEVVAFLIPPSPTGQNVAYTPPKSIDALDLQVPADLVFTKGDATIDRSIDLRQEVIYINELKIKNNSTGDTSCTQTGERIRVPLGPVVTGVVQDQPDNPTLAWAVPGDSGVNPMSRVVVPGGVDVTVRAVVLDTILAGFTGVRLWYYIDTGAILTNPPAVADFSFANSIPMEQEAGNLWVTESAIPVSDGANVWYYLLAIDATRNFDREPEFDSGVFQYYQQQTDVCSNIPDPPMDLSGSATASSVTLSWTAPPQNTDGSSFIDSGGYLVWRNDGTGWSHIADTDASTFTYVDSFGGSELADNNYSYYVTAVDTCSPDANESDPSTTFTECESAPDCVFNVFTSGGEPMQPGDSFTVDLTVCARQNGTPDEIIYMQVCTQVGGPITSGPDADPIALIEADDTGLFQIDGRGEVITFLNVDYTGGDLDLLVAPTDVITVGAWSDIPYSDSTCESTFSCASLTIDVETPPPDPCATQTAPDAPASLVFSTGDCNGYSAVLDWTAPASGADYYKIYECSGSDTCEPVDFIGQTADSGTSFSRTTTAKLKNMTYRWRVTAVNTENGACSPMESGFSAAVGDDGICP